MPKRLYRVPSQGRIAGVCAGIAEYLDADVTLIRLLWIVLSVVPGGIIGGVIAYLAAWLIMPTESAHAHAETRRLTRSLHDRRIAGVCGGFAEYFHVDSTVVRLIWAVLTVVPGCIILGLIAYFVAWIIMPVESVPQNVTASTASV
jgi:phage shock protein PspC (stress-responsive transcriptional regulator)